MESQPRDFRQNPNSESELESQNTQNTQDTAFSRQNAKHIYDKIEDIQLFKRYPINISKDILFNDPIMLTEENVNIAEYIAEDQDNIVLKYGNEKYFLQNAVQLKECLKMQVVHFMVVIIVIQH